MPRPLLDGPSSSGVFFMPIIRIIISLLALQHLEKNADICRKIVQSEATWQRKAGAEELR